MLNSQQVALGGLGDKLQGAGIDTTAAVLLDNYPHRASRRARVGLARLFMRGMRNHAPVCPFAPAPLRRSVAGTFFQGMFPLRAWVSRLVDH